MGTYEIVAVIRPDLDDEGLGAAIERIHQRIGEHGGAVQRTDRWGKRKTAYPIKKYRDGYYVLTVCTIDSGQVARLRQTLGLNEDLLRFTVAVHHPSPVPAGAPAAGTATSAPSQSRPAPATSTAAHLQGGPAPATSAAAPPQGGPAPATSAAPSPPAGGPAPAAPEEGSHV